MTGGSAIKTNKTAVFRLVQAELALTIVTAFLLFVVDNIVSAYSALAGGLAFVLPNIYFVRQAFRDLEHANARMMLLQFYLGEAGKLLFTGLIFVAIFVWLEPVHIVALFVTYLSMILIHVAGSALISSQLYRLNYYNNDSENN